VRARAFSIFGSPIKVPGPVEGEYEFRPCIQSNPCQITWRADRGHKEFTCTKRNSVFVSANHPHSFLWPRVLQGLRLFEIPEISIDSITTFPLSMTRRGAFTAELTPTGSERAVFGAVIGDAAGVTGFWPGRGLNRGLSSAYALAIVLSRLDPAAVLRSADLAEFGNLKA
jgi:2-polyprenyl-6-methoxyphenol hydroxylase-like FAD-dependent oxidoreductase